MFLPQHVVITLCVLATSPEPCPCAKPLYACSALCQDCEALAQGWAGI